MLLVPLIQSFWIIRSQKYAAKASNRSHAASYVKRLSRAYPSHSASVTSELLIHSAERPGVRQ
jgi:hypothetical protein